MPRVLYPVASTCVQHPERHLQNPEGLDIFQATACHCPPAFHERGMHSHLALAPGMPRILDVPQFSNMGVLLLTRITPSAITRAWPTDLSAQKRGISATQGWSSGGSDWAECSTITTAKPPDSVMSGQRHRTPGTRHVGAQSWRRHVELGRMPLC